MKSGSSAHLEVLVCESVSGCLDADAAVELENSVLSRLRGLSDIRGAKVVVSLCNIRSIDRSGLAILARLRNELGDTEFALADVNSAAVRMLLAVSRLNRFIRIEPAELVLATAV